VSERCRWTKQLLKAYDFTACDKWIVPINPNKNHWSLGIVNFSSKRLEYVDSLHTIDQGVMANLARYVADLAADKGLADEGPLETSIRGLDLGTSQWPQQTRTVPRQANYDDCGAYMSMFALCEGESDRDVERYTFTEEDMPTLRRHLAASTHEGALTLQPSALCTFKVPPGGAPCDNGGEGGSKRTFPSGPGPAQQPVSRRLFNSTQVAAPAAAPPAESIETRAAVEEAAVEEATAPPATPPADPPAAPPAAHMEPQFNAHAPQHAVYRVPATIQAQLEASGFAPRDLWLAHATFTLGASYDVEEERRKFTTTKLGAFGSRQIERSAKESDGGRMVELGDGC